MTIKNDQLVKGFSLIEVLVFITILGIFFVVAIAVTTASLRNMKITERRIAATRYAEETIEWLRSEKEAGWSDFILNIGTYCLNSELGDNWTATPRSSGDCQAYNGIVGTYPQIFKRVVTISGSGSAPYTQISVKVKVSWQELNQVESVEHNARFSVWE